MRIIESYRDLAPGDCGACVAVGNFDGVHRGHQALIAAAREQAVAHGAPLGLVTFSPHPRRHFQPDAPPFLLTTDAEQARILAGLGLDILYRLPFDAEFASLTAEAFIEEVLVAGLGLRHVVVGADFRFGKGRQGTASLLRQSGDRLGFQSTIHELIGGGEKGYSSTAVRVFVEQGRCREAAEQLGRWHTVSGPVIQGDQRGRELGYPTANLAFGPQLLPRYGIYACRVTVHDGPNAGSYDGVASIGERPTFGVNAPNFEVHLFDFAGDLYGAEISVGLVAWLRGEVAFEGVEALIAQMDRDSADARRILGETPDPTDWMQT